LGFEGDYRGSYRRVREGEEGDKGEIREED